MRRRPVYIAVLAIAVIALMLAVLTLYAGSRKAPAARSAASAPADVEQTLSPLAAGKNCAVFAAYSADGTVSDYVIDYLRALKEIAPNIVYVTDNPIPESEIAKLRPYVNHLIARRHGEYDWGSYKRGFAWQKAMCTALKKSGRACKRSRWRRPSSADAALFQKLEIYCLLSKRQMSSADSTVLFATKRAGKQSVR